MKDQQEAERKKVTSQEIQQALQEQTKVINQKQMSVKHDLSQVEPAVIEAQNGMSSLIFECYQLIHKSILLFRNACN